MLHALLVCKASAWLIVPALISASRITPPSRDAPEPVDSPPQPEPYRLFTAPKLADHPSPVRTARQNSKIVPLASSIVTIAPSEPGLGRAPSGINTGQPANGQTRLV